MKLLAQVYNALLDAGNTWNMSPTQEMQFKHVGVMMSLVT